MEHSRKIETYKDLMAARGVALSTASPPLWRFCWALGLEIPPPLFLRSPLLFLFTGTFFGVLFGLAAWVLGNRGARNMPLSQAGWAALITGALFGLAMTLYYGRLARTQQLGSWSAFGIASVRT